MILKKNRGATGRFERSEQENDNTARASVVAHHLTRSGRWTKTGQRIRKRQGGGKKWVLKKLGELEEPVKGGEEKERGSTLCRRKFKIREESTSEGCAVGSLERKEARRARILASPLVVKKRQRS